MCVCHSIIKGYLFIYLLTYKLCSRLPPPPLLRALKGLNSSRNVCVMSFSHSPTVSRRTLTVGRSCMCSGAAGDGPSSVCRLSSCLFHTDHPHTHITVHTYRHISSPCSFYFNICSKKCTLFFIF